VYSELDETAVFLVHTLKQVAYGFDQLDALDDTVEDGSPVKAFYLNAIYNYIALLFLLDGKGKVMAGSVYPALDRHGLAPLLNPIRAVLGEPMGETTFGEMIRVFRNTALVHSTHCDADLDRVYADVDMTNLANQLRWQRLLEQLREEIVNLMFAVARSTRRPLEDFGLVHK